MSIVKILSGLKLPRLPPVKDPEMDAFHRNLLDYLRRLQGSFTDENINSSEDARTEDLNGYIQSPTNKSYVLMEYALFECTLIELWHEVASGGIDLELQINGVAVTATGDVTSSNTQGSLVFDENIVAVGDKIELVTSNNSSAVNLAFTLNRLRSVGG